MTRPVPLLIDTDPGVDDALALLLAFNDESHETVGLSITAGNVGLDYTLANALKLVEYCNVNAPVFPGAAAPLVAPLTDASAIHGKDGFGDVGLAPAERSAEQEHAARAIIRLSQEYEGELLLVALGPLTNLALAVKLDPQLPQRIRRLVVMGGAVAARGNITPAAEFNIAWDPEAAHIVFSAFRKLDLVDWQATMDHALPVAELDDWLASGTSEADFYEAISRNSRRWSADRRGPLWFSADALAMAWALQPEAALETAERPIGIELTGQHTRGATVVDWQQQTGAAANVRILRRFDPEVFKGLIRAALTAG